MYAYFIELWLILLNFLIESDIFLSLLFEPILELFRLCNLMYKVQILAFKALKLSYLSLIIILYCKISSWILRIYRLFLFCYSANYFINISFYDYKFFNITSYYFVKSKKFKFGLFCDGYKNICINFWNYTNKSVYLSHFRNYF